MGTPAVTLRHKSIEEVFGKYDFLKIADSIEDFGDKILEALKLPKFQTAVNLIREQFSWDKVTTKICEEIDHLNKYSKHQSPHYPYSFIYYFFDILNFQYDGHKKLLGFPQFYILFKTSVVHLNLKSISI